jgi:hypothetical protein
MKVAARGQAWRFRLLQVLWGVLLVLAIATMVTAPRTEAWRRGLGVDRFTALGLRTVLLDGQWRLDTPWVDEGDLRLIRRGDTLLAVDGRATAPAVSRPTFIRMARQLADAPAPTVTLRVRSADGTTRDLHLPRAPNKLAQLKARAGIDLRHALALETAALMAGHVAMLLTSVLLFVRRGREQAAALLSFGGVLTVMQLGASAATVAVGNPWPNVPVYAASGMCMLLGILVFPDGRLSPPWSRAVLLAIVAWGLLDALDNAGLLARAPFASTLAVYLGFSFLLTAAVAAQIAKYRRLPGGRERQQIRWAMWGFAAAAPFIGVANLLVVYHSRDPVTAVWLLAVAPLLNTLGIIFVCAGLMISMLRYRLYDADIVISRSAGYAVLTLGLAGVWAGAEKTLEVIFEGQFGHEAGAASAGVAAALAALLVTPAHHRVMHWTERLFQKQLSNLRRDLPQTVGDLRETATVERIAQTVLARVGEGVRATHGAVVLDGRVVGVRGLERKAVAAWLKGNPLADHAGDRDRDDPLLPMRQRLAVDLDGSPRTVGWLLLGPRPDGSFYGKDEIEALGDIADPVARAVNIASERQARDARLSRELKAIHAELAELRSA